MKAILSIKPQFVDKIINGEKNLNIEKKSLRKKLKL